MGGAQVGEVTRRDAIKAALKAGAYVSPIIVGVATVTPVGAVSPTQVATLPPVPPRTPRLTGTPNPTTPGNAAAILYTGSGFTPGGKVTVMFFNGDPGATTSFLSNPKFGTQSIFAGYANNDLTTLTADANGNFSTPLSVGVRQDYEYYLPVGSSAASATDQATGVVATAPVTLLDQPLNSILPAGAPSVPLTRATPGVPGETGRGTVTAAYCMFGTPGDPNAFGNIVSTRFDLRVILTGATPNRTFQASLTGTTISLGANTRDALVLTVTTDAAGNANTIVYSFTPFLLSPAPVFQLRFPGDTSPVAYQATLSTVTQNCPFP